VLDRRSDEMAISFLAPFGEGQRARLVAAVHRRRSSGCGLPSQPAAWASDVASWARSSHSLRLTAAISFTTWKPQKPSDYQISLRLVSKVGELVAKLPPLTPA
jgi:hypothetical protein